MTPLANMAPQDMLLQMEDVVSHRPGTPRQRSDQLAQDQVVALDRRGLDLAAQLLGRYQQNDRSHQVCAGIVVI